MIVDVDGLFAHLPEFWILDSLENVDQSVLKGAKWHMIC